MTSPNSMSAQAVQTQRVSIKSVDPVGGTAIGLTRYETECTIDLDYHAGAVHVVPAVNEQWFVKRFGANWMLERKLPYSTTAQTNVVNNPVPGTYQLGSSGDGAGPTNLMGSQINAMAPLKLFAGNSPLPDPTTVDEGSLAYNGTVPVYSNGAAWVPLTTGGEGEAYILPIGGIPATDLSSAVQAELSQAASAYVKPGGGIPAADLASAVQTTLTNASSAYVKPSGGIPETDLDSTVQGNLALGASALQTISNSSISVAQLSAGGSPSNTTFLRGDNVWAVPAGGGGGGTAGIFAVTSSATTTLTLTGAYQLYRYTGTAPTVWTLPSISSSSGQFFFMENEGSAPITLVPVSGDHIWHHAAVSTVTIGPGSSYHVINGGAYWDAVSSVAGIDSQWWLQNAADTTKQAQFSCSNITTATTRTYSLPNVSGIIPVGGNATTGKLAISAIDATGTPSSSTFLRGDGAWGIANTTSGAQMSRTATTTVTTTTGANLLPANFWGATSASNTSDITVALASGKFTVSIAGWYLALVTLDVSNSTFSSGDELDLLLYKNGAVAQWGMGTYSVSSQFLSSLQATFVMPLNSADYVQAGYNGAGTYTLTGEATGARTVFSLVRLNP